jgi:hypothetical protein
VGFVVKVTGGVSGPQWIGSDSSVGVKQVVPRHQAREFFTREEAQDEIDLFAKLLPESFQFEIEDA